MIFEMKYSPRIAGIAFKRAPVARGKPHRQCPPRRAVPRGKAAIRLALLTVSDGC